MLWQHDQDVLFTTSTVVTESAQKFNAIVYVRLRRCVSEVDVAIITLCVCVCV